MDQHPIQEGVERLLVTSCCRNQDKHRFGGLLGSYAGLTLSWGQVAKEIMESLSKSERSGQIPREAQQGTRIEKPGLPPQASPERLVSFKSQLPFGNVSKCQRPNNDDKQCWDGQVAIRKTKVKSCFTPSLALHLFSKKNLFTILNTSSETQGLLAGTIQQFQAKVYFKS